MLSNMHLRAALVIPFNIYDQTLLCHSEKNSKELELFEANGFVGVYWWSHAIIALDWYRYARCDTRLQFDSNKIKKDFLIYNRAWSGSREYRLKFAELVVKSSLEKNCEMKFSEFDGDQHYQDHQYRNNQFKISTELENYFNPNNSSSSSSGDYSSQDYNSCGVEIVLETMFDDQRWHLTEKTLRPIACGKPFILASTPGILQYVKSYGFKTFDSLIDESYDTIQDPLERLTAIVELMKSISSMDTSAKCKLWQQLQEIADYNKKHFFSDCFKDQVINEYKNNLKIGLDILSCGKNGTFYHWYKDLHNQCQANLFEESHWRYIETVLYIHA